MGEFDGGRGMAARVGVWMLLGLAAFAILATAILSRPEKRLTDFDQSFYLTIAHDLDRWGVFSNGIFDTVDSVAERPPPGMFFVPVYPALVYLAMQADPRFARAVTCHVRANEGHGTLDSCEFYARPIHLLHAALLAAAVVAVGLTAAAIFGGLAIPILTGGLATLGLVVEADLFSFVMTESVTIALFSIASLAYVRALRAHGWKWSAAAGLLLGLLVLARPSFMILAPLWLVLLPAWRRFGPARRRAALPAMVFAAALVVTIAPWVVRNAITVGTPSLSAEYGAATLIERFAFNTMTETEAALAFPYCLPVVGPPLVDALFGPEAMRRFAWDAPGSFFQTGRAHRETLVAANGRLDPLIGGLLRDEVSQRGLAYVMSTVPMAWCGLWVYQGWGLLLVPLFAVAMVAAFRRVPLYLLYAGPGLLLVFVHAAAANHYPRYNLMLLGPISIGAAWIIFRVVALALSHRHRPPSAKMTVSSP